MVINSLLPCSKFGLIVMNAVLNWTKSRINCNKSAQMFSWHLFQMPMRDTNVTPMLLNPSRLATIRVKSWAADSPPSRKILVVLLVWHDQICRSHIGQHGSCWFWFRFSTLPPIDPFTIPVRVPSGIWHAYTQDILPYGCRFQIRIIRQVTNCSIQKQRLAICSIFGNRILRVDLSGCWVETATAACQFHMTNFQFMPI